MAIDHVALKSELINDPATLGYAPFFAAGNDTGLTNILNFNRDGVTACPENAVVGAAISIKRPDVSPSEILEAIDIRDFPASPAAVANIPLAQSWLESVTQFASIRFTKEDGTKTTARKNIDRLVGNGNLSQDRLDAIATRFGSRAEQLFGAGTSVTLQDIATARLS